MKDVAVTLDDAMAILTRVEAEGRSTSAADLLERVMPSHAVIPTPQSLNECYRIVTDRCHIMSREHAGRFIGALSLFGVVPSKYELMRQAWRIHHATRFGWWDCTLSAALLAVGKYFREDPQHERQPQGMTIFRCGLTRSSNCSE